MVLYKPVKLDMHTCWIQNKVVRFNNVFIPHGKIGDLTERSSSNNNHWEAMLLQDIINHAEFKLPNL